VKNFLIRVLLFIVAAELIASLAVWHGTPTDWRGRPLSFWYFEMLRLRYWIGFGLAFAVFWVFAWLSLHRLSARLIPLLLAVPCAVATEVTTSIYFWKSLPTNEASYLGWYALRPYVGEHLISWVAVLGMSGLCIWYLEYRKHRLARGALNRRATTK
jgi:hypothetical protein